ncbi:MAG: hypothetical protein KAQ93_06930 [Spirochaetales bacterium]|nr:hypothetical protein [Spirochaetales bacterium]
MDNERTLLEGLLFYTSILLKYKKLIIITTAITAVSIIVFSIISLKLPPEESPLPNIYRAYAVIIFQEGSGGAAGMSSMLSAFGVESSGGTTDSSQLALQVLRSRPFLDQVVKEFNIIENLKFQKAIKTKSRNFIINNSEYIYDLISGTILISFSNIDPAFAADIVNYEVRLLEEWFLNEGVNIQSKQLSMMEEKLKELSLEISSIENSIKTFQRKHGVLDIIEIATARSAILNELRTGLNQVELEISDYSEYSTIEDPALTILKNQRNNIIIQIKRIERGYTGSDGRRMPSQEELPQLSLEFAHMQAELTLQSQLYLTLSERYEVTKLTAAEEGVFSILEYAEVPEEKEGPSRGQLSIKVTFGAFAGSIALAFLLNMVAGIFKDPEKTKILKGKKI